MTNNIFIVERGKNYWEGLILDHNGNPIFTEFLSMTFDEMKSSEQLESFVVTVMDATNAVSKTVDEQTIICLIDEDRTLIWGILIGPDGEDNFRYVLVDWKKDGKIYRYGYENKDLTN